MQFAGFDNLRQLTPQAPQLVVNGAPVCLNLRLAWAANETQTTPLTLEVGPSPHQTRPLIRQCGHLNLQHTFRGACTVAKDFKNQAGPIKQLNPPCLFQIALLNRRDGTID